MSRKVYCKKKTGPGSAVSDVYIFSDADPGPKSLTIHTYTCWGCAIDQGYSRTWRAAKRYVAARQLLQHLQEHAEHGSRIPGYVIALLQTEARAPVGDGDD